MRLVIGKIFAAAFVVAGPVFTALTVRNALSLFAQGWEPVETTAGLLVSGLLALWGVWLAKEGLKGWKICTEAQQARKA